MATSRLSQRSSRIALYGFLAVLILVTTAASASANGETVQEETGGALPKSAAPLKRALEVTPRDAVGASRYCELLTGQGRQAEAIEACHLALANDASPASLRAMVAALLLGGKRPTTNHLLEAMMLLRGMRRSAPHGLYTYAAECDLLEGLGDWPAFAECSARLNELDPRHAQSKRVAAVLAAHRAKWYVSVGWWFMSLMVCAALGHSAFRKFSVSRRKSPLPAVALLAGFGLAVLPQPAMGTPESHQRSDGQQMPAPDGQLSRFAIDPNDPESSVPSDSEKNRDPLNFGYLLMDLTDRAELAKKAGDHKTAIRYYRALAKAVPDRAISFSKLCAEYQATKDRALALANCRAALGLGGVTVDDYLRFVDLVIATPGQLSTESINDIDEIVKHLRRVVKDGTVGSTVECKLGLRQKDPVRMRRCTEQLGRAAPRDPQTISYQWAYAVMRNDFGAARGHIKDAKEIEMNSDAVNSMVEATERAVPWWQQVARYGWLIATAAVGGLFGLAVWLAARRRDQPAGATAES